MLHFPVRELTLICCLLTDYYLQAHCKKLTFAMKEIKDPAEVTMKNGRKAMKGKCPTCGTGMFRMLGKA